MCIYREREREKFMELFMENFQPAMSYPPIHLHLGTIQCQLDMWSIRGEQLFARFCGEAGVLLGP